MNTMDASACGMVTSPDSKAPRPRTCCRKRGTRKKLPNIAPKATHWVTMAMVKSRLRKTRSSSKGCGKVSSRQMKSASATRPTAMAPRVGAPVHP